MKTRTRFIRSVVATAKTASAEMPWARGKPRLVLRARRGQTGATKVRSA